VMASVSGQVATISLQKWHTIAFALWNSNEMVWLHGGDAGLCVEYDKDAIKKNTPNLKVVWSNVTISQINLTY
jgi:hypothetical protein